MARLQSKPVAGVLLTLLTTFTVAAGPSAAIAESPIAAEPTSPALDGMASVDDRTITGQLIGELGFGSLADDLFIHLTISGVIAYDGWRIVPRLPLRFRVADGLPSDRGVLRGQDWDEISDFGRLLPLLSYGRDGELVHVRLGELPDVTIGFGDLVDHYANTPDVDHYQAGLYASVNHKVIGGQLLVDDVLNPSLAVMRVVARPLAALDAMPWPLDSLQIGITGGADFRAPLRMAPGKLQPLVADETRTAQVAESRILPLFGADLALPMDVLDGTVRVTPYASFATLDFESAAFHLGLAVAWRIDALSQLRLRAEYRYSGHRHLAGYVSANYDLERQDYGGRTKLNHLEGSARSSHGALAEARLELPPWVVVGAQVAYDAAAGTDVKVDVSVPNFGPVEFRGSLTVLDVAGDLGTTDGLVAAGEQLVSATTRLSAVAQVRVKVAEWLLLRGAVKQQWRMTDLTPTSDGRLEGRIGTGLDYELGVIGQLRL